MQMGLVSCYKKNQENSFIYNNTNKCQPEIMFLIDTYVT